MTVNLKKISNWPLFSVKPNTQK